MPRAGKACFRICPASIANRTGAARCPGWATMKQFRGGPMRLSPWLLPVFCILLPTLSLPQETTGTIAGVVRDPSNAVLAQARITITNEQTGLKREVTTNALGEYRVPFLLVGVYSVRVLKEGFKSQVQTRIGLEILQVRSVDFTLELGAVTETVTVEGRAPLLEAETSQAGEVI